jgi:hypothetical protein
MDLRHVRGRAGIEKLPKGVPHGCEAGRADLAARYCDKDSSEERECFLSARKKTNELAVEELIEKANKGTYDVQNDSKRT